MLRPASAGIAQSPGAKLWSTRRWQSGTAAAVYVGLDLPGKTLSKANILTRLESAQQDPSQLSQETIVENLDPAEWARLQKVRNIGIAVGHTQT